MNDLTFDVVGEGSSVCTGPVRGLGRLVMRSLIIAATALAFVASAAPAVAAPCKDAKGKFTKCPPKPTKCRLNGKFASCKTPGAKPM